MTKEKDQNLHQDEILMETENDNNPQSAAEEVTTQEINVEEVNSADTTEELQAEIKDLKTKLEEADNRYLRLQADFDNFRRRTRLDQEASEKYRAQSIATDLLSVLDNFERALQIETDNEQTKSLLQGMQMVYRGLLDALKKEGVEPIEAVGVEFDPHRHHAVMQGNDENFGAGVVIEEFQKGYLLKDRVIRPSMVKVNQ
ncbi:nucleotide exchange factor GrpE [Bacillus rubiinfantis]|uniref:nucleotide exchange factor GrpE n=1 Tax=Bacillus rubiinfantis TaxID=1499680 RepID=UPI0005A62A88|nr:nucleotide exchange factor GrpE [Bacillus rubiinfantis]